MKAIQRRLAKLEMLNERKPTDEELESSIQYLITSGQEGAELPPECALYLNNHSNLSTVKKFSDNELVDFICSSIESLIEEMPV